MTRDEARLQFNGFRRSYIRFQHRTHLLQSGGAQRLAVSGDAVARHYDFEVSNVGVAGGEQHADVRGNARDDQPPRLQIFQQDVETGGVKARVLRLEDEVVILVGPQQLDDWL